MCVQYRATSTQETVYARECVLVMYLGCSYVFISLCEIGLFHLFVRFALYTRSTDMFDVAVKQGDLIRSS